MIWPRTYPVYIFDPPQGHEAVGFDEIKHSHSMTRGEKDAFGKTIRSCGH